ncbi:MAG TPA: TIGR04338 family metallohydrolase [Mycobacterium sp.]|mgnify:FL=1|nr:MAG: TIGR04338 family metallohydrolase [Mycobacterium sp.]HMZ12652.1 TIGR04338 family metallohydrolase [Mycobacterium sp.]HNF05087.1 TIGR04338 family metallohydrolase [Mycobacterium sp.]HRD14119.1 TIGR04338 family metallohydrolase [Mycobacterium sp.]
MTVRDTQRSRVYAAEEFVRTLFDRVAQHSSRAIDFFGAQLTLPPEARFGSIQSVQRYVDDVLALPAVADRWTPTGALQVRPRRAAAAAHYEKRSGTGVIAVPDRNTADWAMRELVLLHEIAHHLDDTGGAAHGSGFVATLCELAALVMGPEVGHVLRVVYTKEGVR